MRYRRRYRYYGFPEYVSVGEKKAKAAKKLKELCRKNSNIKPVILEGHAIARTWWGKAWNMNLERYADYSNRIGRGRSYVRHGAVLDLQIGQGEVNALVQGSMAKPYSVCIKIQTLKKDIWQRIKTACEGALESFQDLLAGDFPKTLGEIFTSRDTGMFPEPKEIKFSCSCPDWASMCKHVAATLYGVGARLDEDPKLFFRLRDAEMSELIKQAVADSAEKMLVKASLKSSRVMEDVDISTVFGIDLEEKISVEKSVPSESAPARKKTKKTILPVKRKTSALKSKKRVKALRRQKKIKGKIISEKAMMDKKPDRESAGKTIKKTVKPKR